MSLRRRAEALRHSSVDWSTLVSSPRELLAMADREADLLEHPYVGVEHVELARLRLAGKATENKRCCISSPATCRPVGVKPLGPHSAFRSNGLEQTRATRRAAEEDERRSR